MEICPHFNSIRTLAGIAIVFCIAVYSPNTTAEQKAVSSHVIGTVSEILVKVGDKVYEGSPVIVIETDSDAAATSSEDEPSKEISVVSEEPEVDDGSSDEVGYIEQVIGGLSGYSLRRNNREHQIGIFTPIYTGDVVVVNTDGGEIVVRLNQGDKLTIGREQSPYTMTAALETVSVKRNLKDWVGGFFSRLHGEETAQMVAMTSRGVTHQGEPPLPLLMPIDDISILQDSHESIVIEWFQGTPPFSLFIHSELAGLVVSSETVDYDIRKITCMDDSSTPAIKVEFPVNTARFNNLDLEPGDLRLFLADKLGNVATRNLLIPGGAETSDQGKFNVEGKAVNYFDTVIEVAQFINEGRREWLFDGRQRLGDLSLADYPVRLLGQKLLCDSILAGAG